MKVKRSTEVQVGLFVFTTVVIFSILVFVIGSRQNFFVPKVEYKTHFSDVIGLRPGSLVRLGGVDVGTVTEITLHKSGNVEVRIDVVGSIQHLIRQDSYVAVRSKTIMGDKLLNIWSGSPEEPVIPPGGVIPSKMTQDMQALLDDISTQADPILHQANAIAENLLKATEPLGEDEFKEHVRTISRDVAAILDSAAHGKGLIARLLHDQTLANNITLSVENIAHTTKQLNHTTQHVNAILAEIRNGDGTAHELIYGQSGKRLIANLSDTTGELATILKDVRTNDSTVHDLLYSDKAGAIIDNVTVMTDDLKTIVAGVKDGKGTVGALLMDPSIYEDVKRLVGELERNQVLKALVRYSISQDSEPKKIQVQSDRD